MNTKIIYATLAGGIVFFLLGWLVWGMLLMDFFDANSTHYDGLIKEEPMFALFFVSNLIMAFLISYVYEMWAGIRTITRGFTIGLCFGLLLGAYFDLMFFASMNIFSSVSLVVDIIAGGIIMGIGGAVIGWVLGYGKTAASA